MAVTLDDYLAAAAKIPGTEDAPHGMVVCQCGAVLSRCNCAIWAVLRIEPRCPRCGGRVPDPAPPAPETPPTPEPDPPAPTEGA